MNLKIMYRSAVIWNVVLHFMLSLLFLFLQQAIYEERSLLNLVFFKSIIISYWPMISLVLLSSLLVYNLKKISYYFYLSSVIFITLYSSYQLWLDFSKLILLVLFIYVLVSYYLSFLLKIDLNQAFYNRGYSEKDLFDPMLTKIDVDILDVKNNKIYKGHLTNWDEEGCFIKLEKGYPPKKNLEVTFHFRKHDFIQLASITTVAKKSNGIGVRFIKNDFEKGWNEIYKIISDMGIDVEYIQ